MGGFIMDLKTLCMKGILFIMLFSCSYCYSQYTATLYGSNNRSFGAELRKDKGKDVFGAGMTTFFNREAKGIDYTNIYDPVFAYEMVTGYNGSLFAFYGRKFTDLIVGTRIGLGARKHFYNGVKPNGEEWYVVRDGGTYLLYGIVLSTALDRMQFSFVLDNINGISLGIGIRFNEHKPTKNENNLSHSKRISSLQGTSKPDTTILYTSRLKR
jgi:hypothetical protein